MSQIENRMLCLKLGPHKSKSEWCVWYYDEKH